MPMSSYLARILFLGLFVSQTHAQIPLSPAKTVEETWSHVFENGERVSRDLSNFRLQLAYSSGTTGTLVLTEDYSATLPAGDHVLELVYEQQGTAPAQVRGTLGVSTHFEWKQENAPSDEAVFESDDPALATDADFTISTTFSTKGSGTLFSKCAPEGKWSRNAKALFIRQGRLVYDIGWKGAISGDAKVADGKPHHAVLIVREGNAALFVDGKRIGAKQDFTADDVPGHVFKVGKAAPDFGKDFTGGTIANLRYWSRALEGAELQQLVAGKLADLNTPDLNWSAAGRAAEQVETFHGLGHPGTPVNLRLEMGDDFSITRARVQPLEIADHRQLAFHVDADVLRDGKRIYETLCITCHGTPTQEGSLPTALKFHQATFKNGSDPYRMYQTLEQGYGMMVPQVQYSSAQKYAVIQYIRETFLKPHNPSQYFAANDQYVAELPLRMASYEEAAAAAASPAEEGKPYSRMDFGRSLSWTYQIDGEKGDPNIAQQGLAVRLDPGPGGISKGGAWIVYDQTTMRVATAYSGSFVDWRGIAFDGSHGSHTSIAGDPLFVNPDAPAWAHPESGHFEDQRVLGRDGRRYGPLPSDWVRFGGTYAFEDQVLVSYRVGDTEILEQPSLVEYGSAPVFLRNLNVGQSTRDLRTRLAPDQPELIVSMKAPAGVEIVRVDGFIELRIPAIATPAKLVVGFSAGDEATVASLLPPPADLDAFTKGGPARFQETVVTTTGTLGDEEGPFIVDVLEVPNLEANPWNSWMRLGGFDFFADNPDRAAVCTWLGDVWLVDGVAGDLSELKWRRVCSGLFQPLGLKIVDGKIHVTCRDQIARLHDLNGDEEIDFIENFNNDAQVTEHFHEFAMGLQTDEAGNFYYAKSARHALKAVVPHHGTLLRVSPDGMHTEIVASGFRAANGVCINPDGTWIVTDQEGHWNPKNRINYVREGGFYGNMFGYHDVTDDSDSAMEQPLCWITNAFDRSPAELLWVPDNAKWGSLNGTLLNLSYGYGKVFVVPHEVIEGQAQGGMCALPIQALPTGTHRGRFHPGNGQLYVAGMFAWAGSQQQDGGFFRIRANGKASYLPVKLEATKGQYAITFSDPLPAGGSFQVKTWDLRRTASYGSRHYNERERKVQSAVIKGSTVTLAIPDIAATWGMEIRCELGNGEVRIIHSSIHRLE